MAAPSRTREGRERSDPLPRDRRVSEATVQGGVVDGARSNGRPSGPAIRRYVAMGDSFTAGPKEGTVPEHEVTPPWPDELAAALRAAGHPVEYHNLAVPGASSAEVADVQLEAAVKLEPDLVTVFCGGNDVLLSIRPDLDAFAATLSRIFERLRTALPEAVVLTASCPDFSSFVPFRPRSRERLARGLQDVGATTQAVARRHGVPCLDFAGHPAAQKRENFAADGVHPSREGNRSAAVAFVTALDELFGVEVAGDGRREAP